MASTTVVSNLEKMVEAYKTCLKQYTEEELEAELTFQFRHGADLTLMINPSVDTDGKYRDDLMLVTHYLQAIREEQERRFIA